jgi:hypothetical protein
MNREQLEENFKQKNIFKKFNSAEELRNWALVYLNIDLPLGHVYPDSNSSPSEALYRIYDLIRTGKSAEIPQVVMVSGRDCFKTASAAVLQVILLLHFRLSIAVMSAQKPQSEKAISYINSHFRKISKYLEGHGWKNISDSKSRIEWIDDNGDTIYIRIVVATRSGANCLDPNTVVHTSQGIKKLSEVTTKDLILTRDYRNGLNVYQNVSFIANTQKPTIEIQFEDGSNLICSTDHQIFTHRGWVTADQLKIGTPVIPLSNTPIKNNASNNEIKIERDLKREPRGFTMIISKQ